MPLRDYFKGSGAKVKRDMERRYGKGKGDRVFYATANKRGMAPKRGKRGKARGR
jgi:hypothetical protein